MVQSVRDTNFAGWTHPGGKGLRVADGSRLEVNGIDASMTNPWFSQVRWYVDALGRSPEQRDVRMVQTGPVGTVDRLVDGLLGGDYIAEYSSQGGMIVLASRADASQGLVAWRGRWHEAYAWINVPGAPQSVFMDELRGMAFTDTPEGLLIRLTTPGARFDRLSATKVIPGAGFCEFTRAADAAGNLPKWAGAKLRSGETWRQSLPSEAVGDGAVVLVHATPDVVTVIHPDEPGAEAASLRVLQQVESVRWG